MYVYNTPPIPARFKTGEWWNKSAII
jgi:hypothetical protein